MGRDEFITELYNKYSKGLSIFIKSQIYSKNFQDIEDCVQNVFRVVAEKIKTDEDSYNHSNIKGWLYEISKKICLKLNADYMKNKTIVLEKESLVDKIFIEDDFADQATEDIFYNDINQESLINDLKSKLPKNERDLFELKFEQKLKNKEIAVILNKSEDAIKVKCSRIKQKMKILLKNM